MQLGRLLSRRLASPGGRLLSSDASVTVARNRAAAIAHQQASVSDAADDCFAQPNVAEFTIELATKDALAGVGAAEC